jgi:hypothetical protein
VSDAAPRFVLTFGRHVEADLVTLEAIEPEAVDAAANILDDLAHGRATGKLLGKRHVSGDLTTLARVKFDLPGRRPQRFRLLYRQPDDSTRDIVAIGSRDEHAIYRAAARRLDR